MQVNSIIQEVLFFCLMIIASYIDLKKREIPPFVWVSVGLTALLDFKAVNLIGILASLPFVIVAMKYPNKMGGGDIKLVASTGLVLGLQNTNYGIIIGFTVLVIYFYVYKAIKRVRNEEVEDFPLPLAPFLTLGFFAIYFMKLGGFIYEFI